MQNEEQLREYLGHALGAPVNEAEWELLKDDSRVWAVLDEDQEDSPEELVDYLRRARRAYSGNDPVPLGREAPKMLREKEPAPQGLEISALRSLALSRLIAKEASEEPMVRSFREEVLGGELVPFYDIRRWVRDQHDPNPSGWLTVPITHDPEGVIRTEIRASTSSGNDPVPLGREAPKMLREKEPAPQGLEISALRSLALSRLIAKEASEEPMVRSFREEVLGGELVPFYDIRRWVRDQHDPNPSGWLTVPITHDPEGVIRTEIRASAMEHLSGVSRWSPSLTGGTLDDLPRLRYLEYGTPGGAWSTIQPVVAGSVLDRLLTLAQRLIAPLVSLEFPTVPYPWTVAQATVFVLTGLAPEVSTVKYRVRESPYLSGATRILLDIDPSTTPNEVAQEYRSVRDKILSKRPRAMTEKHLRLAAFAAERPESETWDEKMRAWNQAYPEPQYTRYNYGPEDRRNFHKHVLDAWARLLYPEIRELREPDSNKSGKMIWAAPTREAPPNRLYRTPISGRPYRTHSNSMESPNGRI